MGLLVTGYWFGGNSSTYSIESLKDCAMQEAEAIFCYLSGTSQIRRIVW